MRILHAYIVKELFYYLFFMLAIVAMILLGKEAFDAHDEMVDFEPPMIVVAEYVALTVVGVFVDVMPFLSLFAVLFAVGMMAKNREIIAMVSAGVSFVQLALPVALFGAIVTAGAFWLTEYAGPAAKARGDYLYEVIIKGENQFEFARNDEIFRKGDGERFYILASFDAEQKVMTRPVIIEKDPEGGDLIRRIEAESGRLIEADDDKQIWALEGAERWTIRGVDEIEYEKFDKPLEVTLEGKLDSLLAREKRASQMRVDELGEYVEILEKRETAARLPYYRTTLHAKFSMPLACLLLALAGFAVAADLHVRNFVLAFAVGLVLGVGFFVLSEGALGLGQRGMAPPLIAAWAPVLVFTLIVVAMMRRLSTVH